jgi:hypothetical protein
MIENAYDDVRLHSLTRFSLLSLRMRVYLLSAAALLGLLLAALANNQVASSLAALPSQSCAANMSCAEELDAPGALKARWRTQPCFQAG